MEILNIPRRCFTFLLIIITYSFPLSFADSKPLKYPFEVIRKIPHDETSFTQGLVIDDGKLYETTGLYKNSKIRELDLTNGKVIRSVDLPDNIFGEGITKLGDSFYVLTWKEKKAFVINPNDLKIIKTFNYEGEGWGLTTDGINLIMGDGSDTLYFRNPADFSIIKKISVTFDGRRIEKINELEWIDGMIYANVWYSDAILVIEPENGRVVKWIELSGLQFMLDSVNRNTNTLNGIAYDKSKNKIYLTGKNWSNIFEVKFLTSK